MPTKPSQRARRIDLFAAVQYDIRLHGARFILVEFELVGLGAFILAIIELLHAANGIAPLLGGIWFLGIALNCLAVVLLARLVQRTGTNTRHGDRRLQFYAAELIVFLLIPLAVALAALDQWRAGEL